MSVISFRSWKSAKLTELNQQKREALEAIKYLAWIDLGFYDYQKKRIEDKYDAKHRELIALLFPKKIHMGSRAFRALPFNPVAEFQQKVFKL